MSDNQEEIRLSSSLDQFLSETNSLNDLTRNLVDKLQNGDDNDVNVGYNVATEHRNSFLDLKTYLLLAYNLCLSNFMLLKTEGKKVVHKCINKLFTRFCWFLLLNIHILE